MSSSPTSEAESSPSPVSEAMEARARTPTAVPDEVQQLTKFDPLFQAVRKHGPLPTLKHHMKGLTQAEKAVLVVDMFNRFQEESEVLGVVMTHLWEYYVLRENLWEHYEGGKERFYQDIDFQEFVCPKLKSAKETQSRKERNIKSLEDAWGEEWYQQIDKDNDYPSFLSEHYLRHMAKLASSGILLSDAQQVLHHVMKARIANPGKGVRARGSIMVSDILKVIAAVISIHGGSNEIKGKKCSATQLISILDAEETTPMGATQPQPSEITDPSTPPAMLLSSDTSPFAVEVFCHLVILLSFNF